MSDTLRFEIVSPERLLKDAQAAMVVVPGADGDFTALPQHAPMMSTIRPGVIEIYESEDAGPEKFFLKGGLAQISPEGLTILAEEVLQLDGINVDALNSDINEAVVAVEKASDDVERLAAEKELAWMTALSEVLN
ncbi:ATP synthase F1 subunit epsilon [Kordiimonas aquimaris]|uniref:ATP synthase F1 subunit epsilon n=1 Tax=Kordiimonas aquimaris TaxID=707591 RepID=UPI0021CEAE16|nr:ATP synthase F1 subunit epsilon [Kordiimonas aquimaris]